MANFYKNFASETLMSFGKSFARLNGQPLDKSAIWYSKDEADAYAATGSAYVGQPVAVIDEQAKTTTLYVVGANSTLEMVGALPDGVSIELHEGKIQINGFDEAEAGAQLRKIAEFIHIKFCILKICDTVTVDTVFLCYFQYNL